ncbi:hypothetical protein IMZ08_00510 [Bacillus luteolus]|uniref:Lipoprotein n=1 Tax=Litchfieldia luteola TaxID=682179 RepID=A0ABR9QDH8_9BACI|nr:hypothetical protein [Cytobacillus luteolus]MBE4906536.1 hypothetical protein [Cytobacillus luteolus]MBP1941220.1 outer membrane murein-binding lipoprotein Lpp [Cytobacillus luteolus]
MSKRNLIAMIGVLSLLFTVGCTNKEPVTQSDGLVNELDSKVKELELKVQQQQSLLEEHQEQLTKVNELEVLSENLIRREESNVNFHDNVYMLTQLIQRTTISKTAMLNKAEIKDEKLLLDVTYTNKIQDDEAPNGFRLEETSEGTKTVSISKDVPIFLLSDPSRLKEVEWKQVVNHRGFLQLFEKDGEVVFIWEMYLP